MDDVQKMGDARLLRLADPGAVFDTQELHAVVADMFDAMRALNGAGLAAPQIGVNLRVVIFGFAATERYPDAEAVPETVLVNPLISFIGDDQEDGWEGCLSVPGLRGVVPRYLRMRYQEMGRAS